MTELSGRCQSCGMPLGPGFFGSEKDGAQSLQYCRFCYQKGEFTEPEMTLERMVEKSVEFMVKNLDFKEAKAREASLSVLPKLARWKKRHRR